MNGIQPIALELQVLTQRRSGACHLLEQLLQKSLLYLPCRHHILESVIGNVFDTCLGCSSGPNVQLFVRFKNRWSSMDVDKYQTGYDDNETSCILAGRQSVVDEVVSFIHTTLQSNFLEMTTGSCWSQCLFSSVSYLNVDYDFTNQEHTTGPGGWPKCYIH